MTSKLDLLILQIQGLEDTQNTNRISNKIQFSYVGNLIVGGNLLQLLDMNDPRINIGPSILSCDFGNLADEAKRMIDAGADSLHVDIMDGHFVPNLTIGPPVVKSLRKHLPLPVYLDCHLMVTRPEDYIESLAACGVNSFTFHYQSEYSSIEQVSNKLRAKNMHIGMSIKPQTAIDDKIKEAIQKGWVDMVLVMTVEPGFGGQKFMEDKVSKVKQLRQSFPTMDIQVDGGITLSNIKIVADAGANWIVSGTGIFGQQDPQHVMGQMREIMEQSLRTKGSLSCQKM